MKTLLIVSGTYLIDLNSEERGTLLHEFFSIPLRMLFFSFISIYFIEFNLLYFGGPVDVNLLLDGQAREVMEGLIYLQRSDMTRKAPEFHSTSYYFCDISFLYIS